MIYTKFDGYQAGRRLYPMDKGGGAPQAPDPRLVSREQTRSNIETGNANAILNRVNQTTPWGSLTYSRTPGGGFNQAGYDAAMSAWKDAQTRQNQPVTGSGWSSDGSGAGTTGEGSMSFVGQGQGGQGGGSSGMPTPDDFMMPGADQWSSNVNLSPDQQRLLDYTSRNRGDIQQIAQNGLGMIGRPINTSGMTAYRGFDSFDPSKLPDYRTHAESQFGIQNQGPSTEGIQYGLENPSAYNSMYSGDRTKVEDAIYSRLNPQLQQDRAALEQRLANQGIVPGSEAYNNAIKLSDQKSNDARMQAVLSGGQEQSRLFGMGLQSGQFGNQAQAQRYGQQMGNTQLNNAAQQQDFTQNMANTNLYNDIRDRMFKEGITTASQANQASLLNNQQRQQQFGEASYNQQQPYNQLGLLNNIVSGAGPTVPQFSNVPGATVQPTNTAQNQWQAYQGAMNNYNQQQAGNNSMMSGLFSLGSAALPFFL